MSKNMWICLIIGILLMIAGLGGLLLPALLMALMPLLLNTSDLMVSQLNQSDSIAIIGGADGPTAVFVTTSTDAAIFPGAALALGALLCLMAGLTALNRKRKKPRE